jgi:hypothetical protein
MKDYEQSNAFWRLFVTASLYDTGYGDCVSMCKADRAGNAEDAMIACGYMAGAADMARLVAARDMGFMSRHWRIHDLVGTAAGILLAGLRNPLGYDAEKTRKNCDQWERELRELLAKQ